MYPELTGSIACGMSVFKFKSGSGFLNSLRGRYLTTAGILTLLVLCGAGTAQIYLSQAETQSRINIRARNEAIEYSYQIHNAIRQAEDVQSAFLLNPLRKYRSTLNSYFNFALYSTSELKKTSWIHSTGLEQEIKQLHTDISLLKQASNELAGIRSEIERLFPATTILRKVMLVSNQDFYTAASLGLDETDITDIDPSQREIHELFEACQHEWIRMISHFRRNLLLLTGNFGNSKPQLQKLAHDIKTHYEHLQNLLLRLNEKEQQGQLGLQGSQSLIDMKNAAGKWWTAYQNMKIAHESGKWRADIPFIESSIRPLYDKIWHHLLLLDQHLERSFAEDLSNLTQVAKSSAYALWGLVALLLLAILAGYYILQRKILQPISIVTLALKSENWGAEIYGENAGIENLPSTQLDETRDLIHAFTETSQKIRQRQRQLKYQAGHDALTSLPNRIQLISHIEKEIIRLSSRKLSIAMLLLDLDRFKEINDTLGHQLGDRVLQEVSRRLLSCLRKTDFVARLGGDEFALLLSGVTLDYAEEVAQRIVHSLQEPLKIDNFQLHIGGSIGIALSPLHGENPDSLIRCADVAMYESKRQSCGYMVYNPERDPNSINHLTLVSDFHDALEQNKLAIYYQPKVDVKSGRAIGVEALLRWNHPEHGFISPVKLIPLAEQTGMINDLTHWVLKTAMHQCARWIQNGHELSVAINLSTWDLQDPLLADYIKKLFEDCAIGPQHLVLEITENVMMADPEHAIKTMNQLAAMGIQLAVDDFGTGFSSLAYLKKLPLHELKIDKSFITDMCNNDHDAVLVRSTIDLSHNLGLSVVAEGVENQEIWDLLEILRCDKLQGYFISRPMPADVFENWLQNWKIYPTLTRYQR